MTIVAKFLVLIRRITIKAYFLVIFGGVLVYVTLPWRHIDWQQVGLGVFFFIYPLFVYSCPTSVFCLPFWSKI